MSTELIGILGVGTTLLASAIALAGLILRIHHLTEKRFETVDKRLGSVASGLTDIRDRVSRLKGLLDGLLRRDPKALDPVASR